jgi:asparagine synthase (glutamine-hydrolysing)
MCGIWALIGEHMSMTDVVNHIKQLNNRGPEDSRMFFGHKYQLGFTRLALNGLNEDGMQPMCFNDVRWICNGEIYNWRSIADEIRFENKSGSDCEIVGPALHRFGSIDNFFRKLHGVFAMVIVDGDYVIVGRDPYGVRPLFIQTFNSQLIISSEVKALPKGGFVKAFPPGHYAVIDIKTLAISYTRYHEQSIVPIPREYVFTRIRESLTAAVQIRMLAERPIAALLSGGLDSSLIAALVQQELVKAKRPPLETFSIGFQGSEDLRHARIVADHIGSKHIEIVMTPEDFFNVVPQVVRDIESYDITTVRASVGNWLVAREISRYSKCKVVFNGDGSDEVLGGYLYFYKAPSDEEFEKESNRLLEDIHLFDVLRSDRCISSHGLEPRTPFLDKLFVDVVKSIPVDMRRPNSDQMEKWVLREAFKDTNILPLEVLYRKKEAFSDGVSTNKGISWYEECRARSFQKVPDWKDNLIDKIHLKPYTSESFYYRMIFDSYYDGLEHLVPYFWMPKWSPETTDPSARTLNPSTVNAS